MGKMASKIVNRIYKGDRAEKKISKIEKLLENNGGKNYYASFFGDDITPISCFKFPKKYFETPKYLRFEDYDAPCPSNPEALCELTYGKTYMQYPPENQRISRHHVRFMSCDEPYTKYEGIYYYKESCE